MNKHLTHFERWFATPLRLLRTLENGDGAFIALSVSFALFERYVKSDLKRKEQEANPGNFFADASSLTGVDLDLFKKFWGMYRDGIQHYLQPKQFTSNGIEYGWVIESQFPAMPYYVVDTPTERVIAIDPWKWTDFVLELYEKDPAILGIMESHAFGGIYHRGAGKGNFMVDYLILPMFLCDNWDQGTEEEPAK